VKDEEIARIITQSERDLPRGTGDDFELPWQTTVLLRNTSPRTICDRQYTKKQEISSHAFWSNFKVGKKNIFAKMQFLLLPFVKKKVPIFLSIHSKTQYSQHIHVRRCQQKFITRYSIAQSYSNSVGEIGVSYAMFYWYFVENTKYIGKMF